MAVRIKNLLSQNKFRLLNKRVSCSNLLTSHRYKTNDSKLNFCIVGSGPAGMYTIKNLFKRFPNASFDVYEKLPFPFGLMRYGVAPDHQTVKDISNKYMDILEMKQCSFLGNVNVGTDVTVVQLQSAYHAVILCTGAEVEKKLGIEGENLENILSSKSVVSWYNGHPDYVNLNLNLDAEDVVIIGNGNVALDITRILLSKVDKFKKTDMPEYVLEALTRSRVRRVYIVGRRGPQHTSCTIKEFRDIINITDCDKFVEPVDEMYFSPKSIESLVRVKKSLVQRIYSLPAKTAHDPNSKYWELLYLRSPIAFLGNGCVNSIIFKKNGISGDKIVPLLEKDEISCQLAICSIGFKAIPFDESVPYNVEKGTLEHKNFRVGNKAGMYCNGWAAAGSVGVIENTLSLTHQACNIVEGDVNCGHIDCKVEKDGKDAIMDILKEKNIQVVSYKDWLKINAEEVRRGQKLNKPREKLTDMKEVLNIARQEKN